MMNRTFGIILFALICCATCFGQSSYRGLSPGRSTREDVEKVLGPPKSQKTERLIEYGVGGKQIYVQYGKTAPVAVRIQLVYSPPAARSEILSAAGLPPSAPIRRTNKNGEPEEYFGSPKYTVLTYAENSQDRVSQVGYYSRELFEGVTRELQKWSLKVNSPRGEIPATLSLTVEADRLTGTLGTPFGNTEIKGGKVIDNQIQLTAEGQSITGTIDGDTMRGTFTGASGSFNFTGTRSP